LTCPVVEDGLHGNGVAALRGARGNTKESVLGVDGSQVTLLVESEPGDVVTNAGDVITFEGWPEHGQVGLATRGWESSANVTALFLALARPLDAHDEHVLGEPSLREI